MARNPLEYLSLLIALILVVALFLAFANGANDNFKGVATLFGSGTASYRKSLIWATVTTALGSVTAVLVTRTLILAFSGKGLVPPEVATEPRFAASVALAAGTTIMLATRLGFPISTTHSLIGALLGAGWVAAGNAMDMELLTRKFLIPLATSPILALGFAGVLYLPLRALRKHFGIERETCVCVGPRVVAVLPGTPSREHALASVALPEIHIGSTEASPTCQVRYRGRLVGVDARSALEALHFVSAGAVSFARGLNDTPKIAALILIGSALSPGLAIVSTGVAIALGGLFFAKRVAQTMSHEVTELNPGQGFTANLVTAALVIGASRFGLPVSTTHVSCGSLFGIGLVGRRAHWRKIAHILLAWLLTLPCTGILAALIFWCLN